MWLVFVLCLSGLFYLFFFFFFQAEDGIRDGRVTGVQTCALPISWMSASTAFVQALQRVELADIQAEPTITTVDNRQAEILVGDRVPIRIIDVSAQAGQTTGTGVPRATVQFQQTGINLRVTPHVTQNRQIL